MNSNVYLGAGSQLCRRAPRCGLKALHEVVRVDFGLKDFAALSTGERVAHPRHTEARERRLMRYQRILARKQKGSNNRRKAKRAGGPRPFQGS